MIILASILISQKTSAQDSKPEIPKEKQTTPGLYVTAKEAYQKWYADSAKVMILDVRTPEEYLFVGHAPMAWNVPFMLQSYDWDSTKQRIPMKMNPDFIAQMMEIARPFDTFLVMCRSGGRSALAVNKLAEAGFKNVYNIIDGMEGDLVNNPQSLYHGQHLVNGWKNSVLPWTYVPDPELMRIPPSVK
jgi:rhodanese-related sulfurtransferase